MQIEEVQERAFALECAIYDEFATMRAIRETISKPTTTARERAWYAKETRTCRRLVRYYIKDLLPYYSALDRSWDELPR
ncbi:MAG: hypothetical protein P4M01_08400 [Acidobacteriota bacterium]|nr:hypothetical protein [Acidobacteriota bacterium]